MKYLSPTEKHDTTHRVRQSPKLTFTLPIKNRLAGPASLITWPSLAFPRSLSFLGGWTERQRNTQPARLRPAACSSAFSMYKTLLWCESSRKRSRSGEIGIWPVGPFRPRHIHVGGRLAVVVMCHQKTLLACLLLCLYRKPCMVREDKGQMTTRLSASLPYCAAVSLCEARQGLASRIQVAPNNDDDDWLEKVEGCGSGLGLRRKCMHMMWN